MTSSPPSAAVIARPTPTEMVLSGHWTALGAGRIVADLDDFAQPAPAGEAAPIQVDGAGVERLDTVGVCVLQRHFETLREAGHRVELKGFSTRHDEMMRRLGGDERQALPAVAEHSLFERVGRGAAAMTAQGAGLLDFVGQSALALAASLRPGRHLRWKHIAHNIRLAGVDALPIVGLLSFLLGIVVAYQAADQLRRYGANLFIADLVGLSVLREFAPLMTAIIVAGRSGSAYAAQIGTMVVSEEIDAMRTLAIAPLDVLVLPKLLALVIALPLVTFFADVLGVFGGMVMANVRLGVGFADFLERFVIAVAPADYLIGLAKAPVFAVIIGVVGCFQGFQAAGGADSVGRQTTRSVVQAIFLVIVADAAFSVLFSIFDL